MRMLGRNGVRAGILGLLAATAAGCTAAYFHRIDAPPSEVRYTLAELPWDEVWMGLVFNGRKIGFSHLRIRPDLDRPGHYVLCTDAAMHFHFLLADQRASLAGCDHVDERLRVLRFDYRMEIDRSRIELEGRVQGQSLRVEIRTGGRETVETLPLAGPLISAAGIDLYPVIRGLRKGAQYRFTVYSAELRKLAEVSQRVGPWERSELFDVPAWRVKTRMLGQMATTWIDAQGRPQLEISLNGVLIAGLESERRAREYVVEAALGKQDVLLALSLVPAEPPIAQPRAVRGLDVVLEGLEGLDPPEDSWQQCIRKGPTVRCRVGVLASARAPESPDPARDLASTLPVPSRDPQIAELAREIAGSAPMPAEAVRRLLAWIDQNVERVVEDSFSALDVLRTRRAECQGHSALFAALARSLGIPVRVVNGLVYSADYGGFLFHTWTKVWLDGRWIPVDPTFGQLPADATHLELAVGEEPSALLPLAGVIGHLRARVLAVESAPPRPAAAGLHSATVQ